MDDRHRFKDRYFRPPPALYERAQEILKARGSSVNDYLVECLRLLVGPMGSEEAAGDPESRRAEQ
jgi:hypothetical protein